MITSQTYLTDCFDFMQSYTGEPPALVVTDPPYKLEQFGGAKGFMEQGRMVKFKKELYVDHLQNSYDISTYAELLEHMQQGNINAYFFCNKLQIPQYLDEYVTKRKCRFDLLCWHKTNPMPTFNCKYLTDTEYILYFRNCGACHPKNYDDAKTYFLTTINNADKQQWRHPTIKPLSIVSTLIRNSSNEDDLVFDGFLGSGTTRIAAHLLNRNFIGCELLPQYYDLQQQRYNDTINNTIFS